MMSGGRCVAQDQTRGGGTDTQTKMGSKDEKAGVEGAEGNGAGGAGGEVGGVEGGGGGHGNGGGVGGHEREALDSAVKKEENTEL